MPKPDFLYLAESNLAMNIHKISKVSGLSVQLSWEHTYNIINSCGKVNTRKVNNWGATLEKKTSKLILWFVFI